MVGKTRRKDTERFIAESKQVHGDKYDYSKVDYAGNHSKVVIICPTHGEFLQEPVVHLHGCGCPICGCKKRMLCGVGHNDIARSYNTDVYKYWSRMIKRCYYDDKNGGNIQYKDCSVCDEWHSLSSFAKWFDEHYVRGWALDKDILVKGNKVYSPQTCCFVPQEINAIFTKREVDRGNLPIGVSNGTGAKGTYRATVSMGRRSQKSLGVYGSKEEAFNAYRVAKQARIRDLADKYKGELHPDVYKSLCNYVVEITD